MLKFEKVSLSIGRDEILRDLSFEILPGELVALLGASGAGKSSVFHLLTGEKKPTIGSIKLDEFALQNVSRTSLQNYRRQIGIVFQNFRLLKEKTVFENVAFALEVCGEEDLITHKVPELLDLVGLASKMHRFPRELSGGEIQRVGIARALIHDPKLLIADEATGNLDPKSSREIADVFAKLNKEQRLTILFATHDPVLVERLTPRVIRLEKGKILFDKKSGKAKELFKGIL